MLDKIYKYMPLRKQFFENFLIRGSQKYALNDPFELNPSSKKSNKSLSESSYFDYAVISLSETNNNLLMWAHYADQHKGVVIELDTNHELFKSYTPYPILRFDEELDAEVLDEVENAKRESIKAGQIQRVRYNSRRPNLDRFETIREHFLVKSDEWIYEKEHRIILPLVTADRVIVHDQYLSEIEEYSYSPEVLETQKLGGGMNMVNIKEPLMAEGRDLLRYGGEYIDQDDLVKGFVDNTINAYLRSISEDPSTIFLYRVDPKAIKSVCFGCRVDQTEKSELVEIIRSNKKLKHVKIYQADVNSERFELEIKKN
ncbi:DUF2971 domain-containing protein [Vibrio diabolicus]|uniref:DUF2971 domain-containing protein n=1 Tax=Vibrio diabolicus TaxID=50719 RepID=UPI0031CC9EDD